MFPPVCYLEGIAVFSEKEIRWVWGMCATSNPLGLTGKWRDGGMEEWDTGIFWNMFVSVMP